MVITENYIIHRRGIINMDEIPMWIQRAIAIFIPLFVILALGDERLLDYTGLDIINFGDDSLFNIIGRDLDNYIVIVLLLALASLAISWLIDNIKRK